MACSDCNLQNCPNSSAEGDHQFHTLSRITEEFKKEFDELLKGCTDKVTEICKLEKETWLTLDSVIEKCQKMVADVQRRTEEQTTEITKSSQQLIQQIHDYQVDRTNRVQVFVSDMLMKREELEQLQKSVRHLVQNCSVVEKIQQKEEKMTALKVGKEMELKSCDWEEMALVGAAVQRKVELVLTRFPSSMTYLKQFMPAYGDKCRSVTFTQEGQLLVACDRYLDQHCQDSMNLKVNDKSFGKVMLSLATLNSGDMLFLQQDGSIHQSREPYGSTAVLLKVPNANRIATCRNHVFVLSKLAIGEKLTRCNLQSRQPKSTTLTAQKLSLSAAIQMEIC